MRTNVILLGVVAAICLSSGVQISSVHAARADGDCPLGTKNVGDTQERRGDTIVLHANCRLLDDQEATQLLLTIVPKITAYDLISALDKAAETLHLPKGGFHPGNNLNCNTYFRAIGARMRRLGLSTGPEWGGELQANDIIDQISKSDDWQAVDVSMVQKLADRGVVVEATQPAADNGHIGTVPPTPADYHATAAELSHGPLVRDGNEHVLPDGRLYPGSWGSIRSTKAFKRNPAPVWYAWRPSMRIADPPK